MKSWKLTYLGKITISSIQTVTRLVKEQYKTIPVGWKRGIQPLTTNLGSGRARDPSVRFEEM